MLRKLSILIFVFFLFLTNAKAQITSEDQFNQFTSFYYQNPKPSKATEVLVYFLKSDFFKQGIKSNGHVFSILAYFFGRLANENSNLIREYEKLFDSQDRYGKLFLLNVFMVASDDQNREFLKEMVGSTGEDMKRWFEEVITKKPSGNSKVMQGVRDYDDLDYLWVEFFVTGAQEPIVKLIDVLAWKDLLKEKIEKWLSVQRSKKEIKNLNTLLNLSHIKVDLSKNNIEGGGDMDNLFASSLQNSNDNRSNAAFELRRILGVSDKDLIYMATKGSAMWSLQSNARQHPMVFEYCKQEFERRNDKSKIELAIILNVVSPGTVELLPTGKADMSIMKLSK